MKAKSHNLFSKKTSRGGRARGFTLIEIMVSLALFAIVAVVAIGAFLRIINANKQSQSLQTAMNNTDFALDSMVRDMRVGVSYDCFSTISGLPTSISIPAGGTDPIATCPFGQGHGIAFLSSQTVTDPNTGASCNLIHAYGLGPGNILEKAEQTSCGSPWTTPNFIPLTSTDLHIQSFSVEVSGGGASSQPIAFFSISAYAGSTQQNRTYFTVQTSVSQRLGEGQ